ncbi:hypothetical protein [Nonomuraea dietziae]|uniref:hypothetical protein n=1 Tax=Nonomuraea dietziae TaxID=65515 RepID=UPI0033DFA17E
MVELSEDIYTAARCQADSMRGGSELDFTQRARLFAEASLEYERVHGCFIEAARALLGAGYPLDDA